MFAIIPAEGFDGDVVRVQSVHTTVEDARKARTWRGQRIIAGMSNPREGARLGRGVIKDMLAAGLWREVR
jgi:hypothetical protein